MATEPKKFISPALFVLVFLLFTMPFLTVSCSGEKLATFNGYELASGGGSSSASSLARSSGSSQGGGAPILYVVLLLAAVGAAAPFTSMASSKTVAAGCGAAGALILLAVGLMAPGSVASQSRNIATGSVEMGLWLSMFAMMGGAATAIMLEGTHAPSAAPRHYGMPTGPARPGGLVPPGPPPAPQGRFCGSCGASVAPGTQFCGSCGAKIG